MNTSDSFDLNFILNGTSHEHDLQSAYNGNGFIGVIIELSQVFLAIYDTNTQPFTYTGSENIDITINQVSLNFSIKINDEIVQNPLAYDGAVFDVLSGADNFAFRQNTIHGGQPRTIFDSSSKACTFRGGCGIPFFMMSHLSVT